MITAYFDGACAPFNPGGHMGFGAYIQEDEKKIWEWSGYSLPGPRNTNNVAEYCAFENILDFLLENGMHYESIIIKGDSKLVVCQMNGLWRIKSGYYLPYAERCKEKKQNFTSLQVQWISRDENYIADNLSKEELLKRGIKDITDK